MPREYSNQGAEPQENSLIHEPALTPLDPFFTIPLSVVPTQRGDLVPDRSGLVLRPLAVMMRREIQAIGPDATLAEAARKMCTARVGALWVSDQDAYVGVITEADLVRKAMAEGLDPTHEQVRRVMSSPVISIEIDRSAHDASDLMAEKGLRHLAVIQENRIVGVISVRDLLRYFKNWGSL